MSKFHTYKSEVITAVVTCLLMFVLFLGFLLYNAIGLYVEEKYKDGYNKCVENIQKAQKQKQSKKLKSDKRK